MNQKITKEEIIDLIIVCIFLVVLLTVDNTLIKMAYAFIYALYLAYREYTFYKANGKVKSKLDLYLIGVLLICSIMVFIKQLIK